MAVHEIVMEGISSDKENVVIERMADPAETGRRGIYMFVEILIYVFWPAFIGILVLGLGASATWSGAIASFLFGWPAIKGFIGKLLTDKPDPRHSIRSSSFWFDGFLFVGSPVLRIIRMYSALSQSLDIIYNYWGRFGIKAQEAPDDWWKEITRFRSVNYMIKRWTDFWCKMPIAQDVRSRLAFVANEIETTVINLHQNLELKGKDRPIRIVLLAGGTKQDVIMAVSRVLEKVSGIKFEIVCVEPDGRFALKRAKALMEHFGVSKAIFKDIFKRVSANPDKKQSLAEVLGNNGYDFSSFDLVVCIGLGDYQYGRKLVRFIEMLDNGQKLIFANISDNWIERICLHVLIQWPKMQYLGPRSFLNNIHEALGQNRNIRLIQTPLGIFNIVVVGYNASHGGFAS